MIRLLYVHGVPGHGNGSAGAKKVCGILETRVIDNE